MATGRSAITSSFARLSTLPIRTFVSSLTAVSVTSAGLLVALVVGPAAPVVAVSARSSEGRRDGGVLLRLREHGSGPGVEIGWPRDRPNFRPHVTVGRIKFIKDKRFFQQTLSKFKNIELQTVPVGRFYLIESKLRPQGPVHEVVEEFKLG